jgi:two-component system OmpR family sensor kinase
MTRPPVASFRLRILFRGVFVLLAVATIALAIVLLQDEKERSYRNYQQALRKTHADIVDRLRQPAGMLALLNPQPDPAPPLRPLVLPFAALEFDDQNTVHQAIDQAGCSVRYPDDSSLCVAIGGTVKSAGYLYFAGSFAASPMAGWDRENAAPMETAHRALIELDIHGERQTFVAPFERLSGLDEPVVRGRITAFETTGTAAGPRPVRDTGTAAGPRPVRDIGTPAGPRPVRDFRGDLWQSARCAGAGALPDCPRRMFYAMRLPVQAWRERAAPKARAAWPPPGFEQVRVHLAILGPGDSRRLFDSDAAGAQPPASLGDAVQSLRPGETLTISRQDLPLPPIVLKGSEAAAERGSPLLLRLVSGLPVASPSRRVELQDTLATPVGSYEVRLAGDARAVDPGLGAIATRISWYVSAMLAAIVLAWLVIEVGLIRRILVLSRRAAAVSHDVRKNVRGGERIGQLEVSDLRGPDELGILAGGLADLLQRVKDDVEREELRARQEREMLEAVGHEILSPLQSLMVLFPDAGSPAYRYVQRMRQAVGALYGQASPREALQAAELALAPVDLDEFLFHVASNAAFAGIEAVRYGRLGQRVTVRADEFPLEDVVTHILRNADRHRTPGSPITLSLKAEGKRAQVRIHNAGPSVDEALLERMFEYGVRDGDAGSAEAQGRRGQGLFVARTYMAKMGGSVRARNEDGGVAFYLELPLSQATAPA